MNLFEAKGWHSSPLLVVCALESNVSVLCAVTYGHRKVHGQVAFGSNMIAVIENECTLHIQFEAAKGTYYTNQRQVRASF